MCNRYALSKKEERIITREFGSLEFYFTERFNIAPTQRAPVVLVEDGKLVSREMAWGFKPPWAKGPLTNAQLETLDKKNTFKDAYATRRCLAPATGFYEWTHFCGRRQPILFAQAGGPVFFLAGLWSPKEPPGNFVIITVPANDLVRPVHDRMPFIVAAGDYDAWLAPGSDAYKTIRPSADELKTLWVSDRVNNVRNENAEAARPLLATVKSVAGGYPLPAGLPEGALVKILRAEIGAFAVEFEGREYRVALAGVELKN